MPIAKSAPSTAPVVLPVDNHSSTGFNSFQYDGVDLSLYQMFDIELTKADDTQKERLRDLSNWVSEGLEEKSIGNILTKIKEIDNKLGATPIGSSRLNRIWNHLKISQRINDLHKQQRALER